MFKAYHLFKVCISRLSYPSTKTAYLQVAPTYLIQTFLLELKTISFLLLMEEER